MIVPEKREQISGDMKDGVPVNGPRMGIFEIQRTPRPLRTKPTCEYDRFFEKREFR
jgi:hypothetical protein